MLILTLIDGPSFAVRKSDIRTIECEKYQDTEVSLVVYDGPYGTSYARVKGTLEEIVAQVKGA